MTLEETRTLFIGFLDVCNTALRANKNSFPYKQILPMSKKVFGDRNVGFIVYDDDPDIPTAYFTIRFVDDRIEPLGEGKWHPDYALKVKSDYMERVVRNRKDYIDHPARLDWDWLKSRLSIGSGQDGPKQVKDAMTPGVHSISSRASLREAADTMRSFDVGVLPVIDGQTIVGMLTDRDISLRAVADELDPKTTTVGNIMTPGVVSCPEDADIRRAVEIMKERKIRRLLVLGADGNAAGVVSAGDLAVRVHERNVAGEIMANVCEPAR